MLCLQEELYSIQKKSMNLSKSQYDLSWKPKVKESERLRKSLSSPEIQIVKPVDSDVMKIAFESPKAPIKKNPYMQSNNYGESRRRIAQN